MQHYKASRIVSDAELQRNYLETLSQIDTQTDMLQTTII